MKKINITGAEAFWYVLGNIALGASYLAKVPMKRALVDYGLVPSLTGAEQFWYVLMNIAFGAGYLAKVISSKAISELPQFAEARERQALQHQVPVQSAALPAVGPPPQPLEEEHTLNRILTLAAFAGLVLGAAACSSPASSSPPASDPSSSVAAAAPASSSASAVQSVPQPESAEQAASSLGATGFTNCPVSNGTLNGVLTNGTAHLDGYKIGINAFAGKAQRNTWVKMVADFGIVPRWEGSNWVAYKAQSQHGRACS